MSKENKETPKTEKPADPNQRYLDFKWENPDQFRNGPIDDESRKCRDCICCIIFLVIFALCIVVAGFGFYKGKPLLNYSIFMMMKEMLVVMMKDLKTINIYISPMLLVALKILTQTR